MEHMALNLAEIQFAHHTNLSYKFALCAINFHGTV